MIVIKQINKAHFDVFYGIGWGPADKFGGGWARFHNNNGFIKQTHGEKLPKGMFKQILSEVTK